MQNRRSAFAFCFCILISRIPHPIVMITRPITIIELDMDRCTRTYGVAPCTASLAAAQSCYNTRATCQDSANFASAVQTYRLADTGIGVPPEVEAIPCVQSVSIAPTKLTPMKGLGTRASISVVLADFAHHDRVFDPYVASRSYTPEDQGTFWGRFRARHQYYQGRGLRVRSGTITDPWSWSNFVDRTYFIDRITGPDTSGKVTITAKDVLKLADGDRAQCPPASTSTLSASINSSVTSLTLLPAGIGAAEYAVREQSVGSGAVRIGSEIMTYTRSGDVLTLTRGVWGTTAAAHTAADAVQLCAFWSSVNVATVIKQLLGPLFADVDLANALVSNSGTAQAGAASTITLAAAASAVDDYYKSLNVTTTGGTGSGQTRRITGYVGSTKVATVTPAWTTAPDATTVYTVSNSYLADASWAIEAVNNLSAYSITAIISKPEGVDKLIGELAEQCLALVWWDEVNALIKIRGIAPQITTSELTDADNLINNTVQAADDPAQRVSQVWTFYGKIDHAGDDKPENFRYLYVQADLTAEGADQYGEQKIKTIKSRWLNAAAGVIKTASRALIFLRDNPRSVKFAVDSKDRALDVAESVLMTSAAFQDSAGAPLPLGMIITERAEKGGRVEYSAVNMGFFGRYGRIGPGGSNATGTHVPSTYSATIASYATATSEEKTRYGYITAGGSNATGTHVPAAATTRFADGGEPYKIA